jgi:hypothetical protein
VTNAYKIQVTGTCTVSDGVTTAVSTETFVFSGNENPCLDTFTFTPPPPLPQQQLGPIPDCSTLDPLIPVVLGSTRGTREQPELGGIDGRDGCAHRSARRRNERRGT